MPWQSYRVHRIHTSRRRLELLPLKTGTYRNGLDHPGPVLQLLRLNAGATVEYIYCSMVAAANDRILNEGYLLWFPSRYVPCFERPDINSCFKVVEVKAIDSVVDQKLKGGCIDCCISTSLRLVNS